MPINYAKRRQQKYERDARNSIIGQLAEFLFLLVITFGVFAVWSVLNNLAMRIQ